MRKYLAKELCGEHIGARINVFVPEHTDYRKDPQTGKFALHDVDDEWVFSEITMITHKKNGDVIVRTKHRQVFHTPDAVVEVEL